VPTKSDQPLYVILADLEKRFASPQTEPSQHSLVEEVQNG